MNLDSLRITVGDIVAFAPLKNPDKIKFIGRVSNILGKNKRYKIELNCDRWLDVKHLSWKQRTISAESKQLLVNEEIPSEMINLYLNQEKQLIDDKHKELTDVLEFLQFTYENVTRDVGVFSYYGDYYIMVNGSCIVKWRDGSYTERKIQESTYLSLIERDVLHGNTMITYKDKQYRNYKNPSETKIKDIDIENAYQSIINYGLRGLSNY